MLKRGLHGVYQYVSEKYLHRYLLEVDCRYSYRAKLGVDDNMRAKGALMASVCCIDALMKVRPERLSAAIIGDVGGAMRTDIGPLPGDLAHLIHGRSPDHAKPL